MDKLTEFNRCFKRFQKHFKLVCFQLNCHEFSVFGNGAWFLTGLSDGAPYSMNLGNPVQPEAEAYGESIELARAISKAGKTTTKTRSI